jgi:hypothetical protein
LEFGVGTFAVVSFVGILVLVPSTWDRNDAALFQ